MRHASTHTQAAVGPQDRPTDQATKLVLTLPAAHVRAIGPVPSPALAARHAFSAEANPHRYGCRCTSEFAHCIPPQIVLFTDGEATHGVVDPAEIIAAARARLDARRLPSLCVVRGRSPRARRVNATLRCAAPSCSVAAASPSMCDRSDCTAQPWRGVFVHHRAWCACARACAFVCVLEEEGGGGGGF